MQYKKVGLMVLVLLAVLSVVATSRAQDDDPFLTTTESEAGPEASNSGKARIHTFLGRNTSIEYQGATGWWSTESGYDLSFVHNRMVVGDFDNDYQLDDTATFYDYGDSEARIHVFLSDSSHFDYQGSSGWWSTPTGYSLSAIGGRMVVGDFDNDSWVDDIATFYDYGDSEARIHVFLSNGSSFDYQGPSGWWSTPTGYSMNAVGDRIVVGDFDNDFWIDDIATFYDYGDSEARIHVFLSDGSSFDYQGPSGWWSTPTGYLMSAVGGRMVVGDFDSGGLIDDIATFYDYGDSEARIHVFLSDGSSFDYQGPSGWWSTPTGYSMSAIGDRMVVGDFDNSGSDDDIATFYDYGNSEARIHVFLSNGSSFDYQGPSGWWSTPTGYFMSAVEGRMVAGDFDGGGSKDDIATFYNYDPPGSDVFIPVVMRN